MPICNACGAERDKLSKEHLIQMNIGQAILGSRDLTQIQVRERFRNRIYKRYETSQFSNTAPRRIYVDMYIKNFICRACNGGPIRELQEATGRNLYDFLHLRGPADAHLLKRWAWFFTIKLLVFYERQEELAEGPLRNLVSKLVRPETDVRVPVTLARMDASPRRWEFAVGISPNLQSGASGYVFWITHGVAWFTHFPDKNETYKWPAVPLGGGRRWRPAAVPTTKELTDGMRLSSLPRLSKRQVAAMLPPAITKA